MPDPIAKHLEVLADALATPGEGPRPYYQDASATLYHGDCSDVLPLLTAHAAHVIVTDPPYGQDFQSNKRTLRLDKIAGDDGLLDVQYCLALACRVLRRGRHAYMFGPVEALPDCLTARTPLIWDKDVNGLGDLASPWGLSHEPITFAVYELSAANRAKGYGNLAARMRKQSVLRVPRLTGAGTGRHPNEKPVLLLRQLIESSSVMGEIVLDPFAGSGSTLVAATLEGRSSIGIEIDERHCAVAAARLALVADEAERRRAV